MSQAHGGSSINASFFFAGVIAIVLYYVWPSSSASWEFHCFSWFAALICCAHIVAGLRSLFRHWQHLAHVSEAYKPSDTHGQAKSAGLDDLDDF